MPAATSSGLEYMPTTGHNIQGTIKATDSAFESNNFTYSESGFNPAGSLR